MDLTTKHNTTYCTNVQYYNTTAKTKQSKKKRHGIIGGFLCKTQAWFTPGVKSVAVYLVVSTN